MAQWVYGTKGNDDLTAIVDTVTYVYGRKGNDILRASEDGSAIMSGGAGADQLIGGAGFDRFVFVKEERAFEDRVYQFDLETDELDFSKIGKFDTWRDVIDDAHNVAEGVVIDTGKGSVRIWDVSVEDLGRDHFFMG